MTIDVFDIIAFIAFAVLLTAAVMIIVVLGGLPGRIAVRRGHPYPAAVERGGLHQPGHARGALADCLGLGVSSLARGAIYERRCRQRRRAQHMIAFMTIIYVATVALVFKVGRRTGQSEILGGRGEPATGNSRREPGGQGPAIGHQRRGHREGPIGFGQVQSRSNHDHGSGRRLRYRLADPRRQHGQPSRYDGRRYVHRDIRNIHCRFVRGRGTDPRPARPGR